MRESLPIEVAKARVKTGPMASDDSYGFNGAFVLRHKGRALQVIVSDGLGWEHVSVSLSHASRCPSWEDMRFVKDLFWRKDETVVQYHPAARNYVNFHPHCLHMWKPIGQEIPIPPTNLVGPA